MFDFVLQEAGELYDGFAWELLKDENTDHDLARDMLAMLYFGRIFSFC